MENLIPIVLAIAYFAYKQYKKSLDNKEQQGHQASPMSAKKETNAPLGLEDFLNTFIEETGLKTQEKEIVSAENELNSYNNYYQPEELNTETNNEPQNNYQDTDQYVKQVQEESHRANIYRLKNKNKQEEIKINNTEVIDFDLRQAVVYDAIINAPYLKN